MSITEQLQQELTAAREDWKRCAMELADAVRERDEARADLARSVAAWEAAGMQGRTAHDAMLALAKERDEARAEAKMLRSDLLLAGQGVAGFTIVADMARERMKELRETLEELQEARAEVERLKAQHLERHLESWEQYMQDNDVKRAYRRGAEAMREVCAQWVDDYVSSVKARAIRALPIPEAP